MNKELLSGKLENQILCGDSPPTPLSVEWQLTYRCNAKCVMCDMHLRDKTGELSTLQVVKVIKELKELGCKMITLSGGEPFLRTDLFEIIKYCNKKGVLVAIHTNGLLINSSNINKLAKLKVHSINISLHHPSSRQDEVCLVKGSFEKIVKSIYLIKKNMSQTKVNVRCVLTKNNYKSIEGFSEVWNKAEFDSLKFLFVRAPAFNKNSELSLTKRQIKDTVKRIKDYYFVAPFKVKIPYISGTPFDSKKVRPAECLSSYFRITITPTGNVIPSCYCENIVLGNVKKESFEDIWIGEKAEDIRHKTIPFCKNCEQRQNLELNKKYKRGSS